MPDWWKENLHSLSASFEKIAHDSKESETGPQLVIFPQQNYISTVQAITGATSFTLDPRTFLYR